ncbi:DUF3221 domain-containing protein [Paenibacillus sedimenti]|uniref:DUF3221 domain-containing protein n=1 Tax=Paenibacillus sedimenti TaxID=2770274 RepID=A0A926QN94_9BACL|nr:DUF3221 domain-containing protein [Paenibacillus sedimenti]MBD0384763.1 DUF3221 domain-containing protein [Paenibacillus sedimenti]
MKAILSLIIASATLATIYYCPVERFEQSMPNPPTPAVPVAPVLPDKQVVVPLREPAVSRSFEQIEAANLQFAMKKLEADRKLIEQRHSIQLMMMGIGKDHIMVQVRRTGDVENPMPEDEIEAVKQTLFGIAGGEFPLELSVMECCKNAANVTGKIRSYDKEQDRILIVNEQKKNGNTDDPEATWVGLQTDAVLVVDGSKATGLSESLVGREAKVWTTGVMMTSYPGQTSAIKIVIE